MASAGNEASSFLRELKRRKVIRSCIYYLVLCWVFLQVGDIVFPALDIDADKASRYLLYAAVLGFPLTFVLAWYFQITSDGIVRTTSFKERRVLNNISPIDDQRHANMKNYLKAEEEAVFSWVITAETGPLSGLSYGVSFPIVLGRSIDCEIAIVSPHVSRRHAYLDLEDEQLYIEDLGSSNGTVINGKKVEGRQALRHEDELRFHDVIFRITESVPGKRQEYAAMSQTTFIGSVLEGDSKPDR